MSEAHNAPEFQSPELQVAPEQPQRSLEEVARERDQTDQVIDEIHQKETAEAQADLEAQFSIFVVENEFFDLQPQDEGLMVKVLLDMQSKAHDFDIRQLDREVIRTQISEKIVVNEAREGVESNKKANETEEILRDSWEGSGKDIKSLKAFRAENKEALDSLLADENTKASMEALMNRMDALIMMTNASPEYATKFEAAGVNIFDEGAVLSFMHTSGFWEDDSIDESLKTEVATKLGFQPDIVKTGSDIQDTLTAGHVDVGTGERKPYTKDFPYQVDDTTVIYEKPTGERVVQVNLPNGREISAKFEANTGGAVVGQIAYTVQIMYQMERFNLAGPVFQRGHKITHGGEIDIHYDDIIRAKTVGDILIGGDSGYDGEVLRDSWVAHRIQGLSSDGDHRSWTNDPEQAERDLKGLGIVKDGDVDFAQFRRVGNELNRVEANGGAPDYALLVKEFAPTESQDGSDA